jgi:hypothetical protein
MSSLVLDVRENRKIPIHKNISGSLTVYYVRVAGKYGW